MDEGLIARRYALAMLKVAQKYNAAEEVYQKMKTFEQNYISHPDLHKALLNPILSPRDKEQLIGRRGGTADVSTSVSTSLELPEVTIHRMIFAKS